MTIGVGLFIAVTLLFVMALSFGGLKLI